MTLGLTQRLAARVVVEGASAPRSFDLANAGDAAALEELVTGSPDLVVHDTLDEQLRDLLASRAPGRPIDRADLDARVLAHLGGTPLGDYGRWVHFPWSRRLVHLLGPSEFHELRSDRNRYKITAAQQAELRRRRIGVVGLSVGQATAVTLALEGVGGQLRLADFDTLALSNLNRLRAGVHGLGVNKAILAAREIHEIDPYLDVRLYPAGITDDGLDAFLTGDGGIDLLVEECDDLYVKVRLRERARELGIPVIMETSDRGMLDIERFDREPHRALFHGLLGDAAAESLRGLSPPDKVPWVLRILGERAMSTAGLASLVEIRHSISTWPQLASAVALGGALATDSARRILLGQLQASGRYYVDLDALVRDGSASPVPSLPPPGLAAAAEALEPWSAPPRPPPALGAPSPAELRWLVAHAALAPSEANAQPWRFVARSGVLDCRVDGARARRVLDPTGRGGLLAVGCAVENLVLAAPAIGLEVEVVSAPDPGDEFLAASLRFRRAAPTSPPLYDCIGRRATNRRLAARAPLRDPDRRALLASVPAGAHLDILDDGDRLDHLGQLLGAIDRLRLQSEALHDEWVAERRWSPAEVTARRDGIDLATLELSPLDLALTRVHADGPAMRFLAGVDHAAGVEASARRMIAASSAVALLSVGDASPRAWFHGGRALERVWLTATALDLALQPILVAYPPGADASDAASPAQRDGPRALETLRATRAELTDRIGLLHPLPAGHTAIVLVRLAAAASPSARALRRPVADVLAFEPADA